MSEVRASFEVPNGCAPTACCDPAGLFDQAIVTPGKDCVFVSATDGRCASVVKLDGNTDKSYFLPKKAVAKGKPRKRGAAHGTMAVLNGRWECDGKFVELPPSGSFPKVPDVFPDVEGYAGDMVCVSINPELLSKIAAAVGTRDSNCVTLLMRRRLDINSHDYDARLVAQAITVVGPHGVGLLMPTEGGTVPDYISRVKEFHQEYSKTFSKPE